MNKKLSLKAFIISQVILVVVALLFIGGLYFYLYGEEDTKKPFKDGLPLTTEPISLTLDVTSPDDDLLIFKRDLEVSGKTGPNMFILISSNSNDLVAKSKEDGTFSVEFKLEPGVNELKIIAFDKTGDPKEIQKSVFYSKEKI